MKVRALRLRPRGMIVCRRGGGWGWVMYSRKRAYDQGRGHCPADSEDLHVTADVTQRMTIERHESRQQRSGLWATKTPEEVLADIRACLAAGYSDLLR